MKNNLENIEKKEHPSSKTAVSPIYLTPNQQTERYTYLVSTLIIDVSYGTTKNSTFGSISLRLIPATPRPRRHRLHSPPLHNPSPQNPRRTPLKRPFPKMVRRNNVPGPRLRNV